MKVSVVVEKFKRATSPKEENAAFSVENARLRTGSKGAFSLQEKKTEASPSETQKQR